MRVSSEVLFNKQEFTELNTKAPASYQKDITPYLEMIQNIHNSSAFQSRTSKALIRPLTRPTKSRRETNFQLPLGLIHATSCEFRSQGEEDFNIPYAVKKSHDCVVYPNYLARLLGFSQAFRIAANFTTSWQYTIQPFRAVSPDSLIFDLCRQGDAIGVKILLRRGDASFLDCDPSGMTPLRVSPLPIITLHIFQ